MGCSPSPEGIEPVGAKVPGSPFSLVLEASFARPMLFQVKVKSVFLDEATEGHDLEPAGEQDLCKRSVRLLQAAIWGAGAGLAEGSTPQMTLAYSEMVRSVENCAMEVAAWMLSLVQVAWSA